MRSRLVVLAGVLLALQVCFFGLLVAAQAVPDRPIVSNLVAAVDDGTYGPIGRPDLMGGRSASYSECVIAGTGLGRPQMNVFERAIRMPRIGSCTDGVEDLRRLDRGAPVIGVTDYFRYWAGYTVVTRPALALWGLEGARMLSGALLAVCGAAAVIVVSRATNIWFAAALGLPLVAASNVMSTPSSSFGFALSYSAALFGVLLTAHGARRSLERAVLGAVVGAAIFNYATQLTTPAVPWMMSATVAGAAVFCRTLDVRRARRAVVAVGVAWPIAFAITWASRWAITAMFIGWDETERSVGEEIEFRLAGQAPGVRSAFGAATTSNVRYWLDKVPTASVVLGIVIVAVIAALIISYRRFGRARFALFAALSLPAVIVPLWYELLSNHSQIHPSFVYANIPAALGIVLGAAMLSTGPRHTTTSSSAPGNVLPASDAGDSHSDGLLASQLSLLRYTL